MKSRFFIGSSVLALLVLIVVQYVFITETYRTKKEQFDSRFGSLAREAISKFNSLDYRYDFDSVLFLLDERALEFIYESRDSMSRKPGEVFQEILNQYREPEYFIRDYIHQAGEDPEFTYHLQVDELYLVDMGFRQRVYPNGPELPQAPANALLAGNFTHERNFFNISYSIYIDFVNRSKLILREMWLILVLDLLTLVLVFTVFILTLRNMLQQKRLSEMKSDFISNMTHELKTPLSTISVASSSLGKQEIMKVPERVEELSGLIKRQNRHLSDLIDRILDIHIWEKDQVRLKPQHIQLENWTRQLVAGFQLEHEKASPEICLDFRLNQSNYLMDGVHMSTVLNNLFSNAVRYGKHPCRIEVLMKDMDHCLWIRVSDNGPGIKKEDQKHLFEKFFRGEEARQRVVRGLGLGLYYVKQIVEAHGGTITVQSKTGEGTSFHIKIPTDDRPLTC
ncbi:MAG: HAMP domain-containing sensor histidine kinase [Bacteroidales bacterium]|nr:HAMP domain-containing sensor histidine kinase [Bacteroidales bacterium]